MLLTAAVAAIPPLKVIFEAAIYGEFGLLEHQFDRFDNGREFWAGFATAVAWLLLEVWLLI